MTCPACQAPAPDAARFCASCGAALPASSEAATEMATSSERAARPVAARLAASPGVGRLASSDRKPTGGFTPGTILIDRYRIIGLLGRGGMGEVYRADDLKLGQPVALKFLPRDLAQDPVRRERFLGEVRIARQVSHPNLCRVYDIGEVDDQFFLTMEYIDGEDLASLLRRIGVLHGRKALDIARQLCAGLAAAHDKGVLHRDLKPANVMIDGRGRVRITDFGLALAGGEAEAGDEMSGTPAYMAPEQFAGQGASVRSDIHALGLVLYELYTGKKAVEAQTLAELRQKKASDTPRAPSEITRDMDPVVERVILRCLEKDPRARPASVTHVAAALPGGDPLAAALAAGETPSPEMVAASGDKEALRPATAWGWLAFVGAGAVVAVLLNERAMPFAQVVLEKSPEVLVERARQVIGKAGYPGAVDTEFGFEVNPDFYRYVGQHEPLRASPDYLKAGAVEFWYRQSPRPLERAFFLWLTVQGTMMSGDPPPKYSGEVAVRLDPRGRLRSLRAIPPERHATDRLRNPAIEFDWAPFFVEAGLDIAGWTPVAPEWNPATYADARAAWLGHVPELPGVAMRVEAASYADKPVAFNISGPWTRAALMIPYEPALGEYIASGLLTLLLLLVLVSGALFARNNLRLGRGDRRGATRLAALSFTLTGAFWVLGEHHVSSFWEVALLSMHLCWSLATAVFLWVLYVALEPFVRRRWPQVLVSWTRLLSGDWRDPLVGRDVLLGCLTGVLAGCLFGLQGLIPSWLGYSAAPPQTFNLDALHGTRTAIAMVVGIPSLVLFTSLFQLFLLVMLRAMLRRVWLAAVVWVVIPSLEIVAAPWSATGAVLGAVVMLVLLLRFGFLPFVVAGTVQMLFMKFPMTFSSSAWYFGVGFIGIVALAGLALYGFRTSLGGRPLFGTARLEEA